MTDITTALETLRKFECGCGEPLAEHPEALAALSTIETELTTQRRYARYWQELAELRGESEGSLRTERDEAVAALHRIIVELDAAKPGSNVESVIWNIAQGVLQSGHRAETHERSVSGEGP